MGQWSIFNGSRLILKSSKNKIVTYDILGFSRKQNQQEIDRYRSRCRNTVLYFYIYRNIENIYREI